MNIISGCCILEHRYFTKKYVQVKKGIIGVNGYRRMLIPDVDIFWIKITDYLQSINAY
jgi:hypothetical protein